MKINLTNEAITRIKDLIENHEYAFALRMGVVGGGCNGFNYEFSFAEEIMEDDTVIETAGVTVVIDAISIRYLDGATLDYTKSLSGDQFVVDNPSAQTQCGCGTSFSIF